MGYFLLSIGCLFIGVAAVLVYLFFVQINCISYEELRNIPVAINELHVQKRELKEKKRKKIVAEFGELSQYVVENPRNNKDQCIMEYENTLELARKRIKNNLK